MSESEIKTREIATLGGGCYWCLEAVFDEIKGVESVESGFSGGTVAEPTYEQVCSGNTGHAEVVQITFEPSVISFRSLLRIFFSIHDPTTLNRQGPDVGTQYRSVIFYHSEEQQKTAHQVIQEMQTMRMFDKPIVTQVVPFEVFYIAEEEHQEYFKKNPNTPYCQIMIAPKLQKFRVHNRERLKKSR